jgi:hypothetical protein
MKHAGAAALRPFARQVDLLRRRAGLMEKKPGIFYRRGRAFLHFHEDPAGLFADLRSVEGWQRFPVNRACDWAALMRRVDALDRD